MQVARPEGGPEQYRTLTGYAADAAAFLGQMRYALVVTALASAMLPCASVAQSSTEINDRIAAAFDLDLSNIRN